MSAIAGTLGLPELALLSGQVPAPPAPANPLASNPAAILPAPPGVAKGSVVAALSVADFTAVAIQHFGRGVRWEQLQVDSVPGWQYGEHPIAKARRLGRTVETFEPGTPMTKPLSGPRTPMTKPLSGPSVPRGPSVPSHANQPLRGI